MKNPNNAPLSLNDIIFEGRNKLYGAYLLRQIYHRHLLQATFVAVLAFMLFVSFPLIARLIAPDNIETPPLLDTSQTVIELQQIEIPKPEQVKTEIIPPPATPVATIRHTTPVIVNRDVKPSEEMASADDLKNKAISTTTTEGADTTIPNPAITNIPAGTGTGTETGADQVFVSAEQMPVFGSGEADLLAYLGKNFKFPPQALKAGVDGTIYLSFTITKTGDVADIKVLKGLGYGIDEEARRLLANMPKWQPGRQNGREVAVTYNLPFRLKIR